MQRKLPECTGRSAHQTRYIVALFSIALLASCNKAPDRVLPEKKMKDVVIDMRLVEMMINWNKQAYSSDSAHKAALYASVLEKHHVTQAVYDSSLVWYGENLDVLLQVYDKALHEIAERIRQAGAQQTGTVPE